MALCSAFPFRIARPDEHEKVEVKVTDDGEGSLIFDCTLSLTQICSFHTLAFNIPDIIREMI